MAQTGTNFPKVRRMLRDFSPLIFGYVWPTSTLLHWHIAQAIPSLPETDPQILEHWDYADEVHLGILVSNVSVTYDGFGESNSPDSLPAKSL